MTQNKFKDTLTVIIAVISDQTSFVDCLNGLRNWPVRIIIVSKSNFPDKKILKEKGHEWIQYDSSSSLSLWGKGLECSDTPWNLLIRSNEVVSGRLKINIEEKFFSIANFEATKVIRP